MSIDVGAAEAAPSVDTMPPPPSARVQRAPSRAVAPVQGEGVRGSRANPKEGRGREVGVTHKEAKPPKRHDVDEKTKADILHFLEGRAKIAGDAQREGRASDNLDTILAQEWATYQEDQEKPEGEQRPTIFSRIQGGDLSENDLALVWLSLSMTETSNLAATGGFGVTTEDAYASQTGIAEREQGRIARLLGRDELGRVTRLRQRIERRFYRGGRFSPEYRRHRGMTALGDYDLQNGNAFHNIVARHIDRWEQSNPGQDWNEFVRSRPAEAQAVLREAQNSALMTGSDEYAQRILDTRELGDRVDPIQKRIQEAQAGRSTRSTESGGNARAEEEAVRRARETAEDLNVDLTRRVARRDEISPILQDRRSKEAELGAIPDQITTAQDTIRTQDAVATSEAARAAAATTNSDRTTANTAARTARELATAARNELAALQARQARLRAELAAQGSQPEMDRLQAELDTLNREINGVPGDPDENVRRGFKARKEAADEEARQAQRTLENRHAELARNKSSQSSEGEQSGNADDVARLTLWKNVATASGENTVQQRIIEDRAKGAQFRRYDSAQISSTAESGPTDKPIFEGAERIRELVLGEAAIAAQGSYPIERAREALPDEAIIRAAMQVDDRIGARADADGVTVRELVAQIDARRRPPSGESAEDRTAREGALQTLQTRLTRLALPGLSDWQPWQTQLLVKIVSNEGTHSAALGRSELQITGGLDREVGIRLTSAEDLARQGVGAATVTRGLYPGVRVDWAGNVDLPTGSGPGAEFASGDGRYRPVIEVTDLRIDVDQNGPQDRATVSTRIAINEGLRQRLPRVLTSFEDLRRELGDDVDDATLQYVVRNFYRRQGDLEATEQVQGPLAIYPQLRGLRFFRDVTPMVGMPSPAEVNQWIGNENEGQQLILRLNITQAEVDEAARFITGRLEAARTMAELTQNQRILLEQMAPRDPDREERAIVDWEAARTMAVIGMVEQPNVRAEVEVRYMMEQRFPGLFRRLREAPDEDARRTVMQEFLAAGPELWDRIQGPRALNQFRPGVNQRNAANDEEIRVADFDSAFAARGNRGIDAPEFYPMTRFGLLDVRRVLPRNADQARMRESVAGLALEALRYENEGRAEDDQLPITQEAFDRIDGTVRRNLINRMIVGRALNVSNEALRQVPDERIAELRRSVERIWAEQDRAIDGALANAVRVNFETAQEAFDALPLDQQLERIGAQQEVLRGLPRSERRLRRQAEERRLRRLPEAEQIAAREQALQQRAMVEIAANPVNGYTLEQVTQMAAEDRDPLVGNQLLLDRINALQDGPRQRSIEIVAAESRIRQRIVERIVTDEMVRQQALTLSGVADEAAFQRLSARRQRRHMRDARQAFDADPNRAQRIEDEVKAFDGRSREERSRLVADMREQVLREDAQQEINGRYVLQASGRTAPFRLFTRTLLLPGRNGRTEQGPHPDTGMAQLLEPPLDDEQATIQEAAMRNVEIATANYVLYETTPAERVGGTLRYRLRGPLLSAFTVAIANETQVPDPNDKDRMIPGPADVVTLANDGQLMIRPAGSQEAIALERYYDGLLRNVNLTDRDELARVRGRVQTIQAAVGRQILLSLPRR